MRVAFLTTTLKETDGWGRYAAGFLTEAKRRHGARNVVVPDPKRLCSGEIRWWQPFAALADAVALRRELEDVDVIHAAVEPAAPAAFLLSLLLRKPYVVSLHGTYADLQSYSSAVRWLYARAFGKAAILATVSGYTSEVVRRRFPSARIRIVPGGFAPPSRTGTVPVRHRGLSPKFRILTVGAVKPRKGIHTLVEALGLLKTRGLDFRADIVGARFGDAYEARLAARIKELGLEDRVRLRGQVLQEELDCAYDEADLFVLPSERVGTAFEGLGLVYLEALARGLPAVGCLESGAEDVIQDGVNGRLVPPGNPEKLAEAVASVFGDAAALARMSAAAPGTVGRFRWERVGAEMDAVYGEAANERKKE